MLILLYNLNEKKCIQPGTNALIGRDQVRDCVCFDPVYLGERIPPSVGVGRSILEVDQY